MWGLIYSSRSGDGNETEEYRNIPKIEIEIEEVNDVEYRVPIKLFVCRTGKRCLAREPSSLLGCIRPPVESPGFGNGG